MSPRSWTSLPPPSLSHCSRLLQIPSVRTLSHIANFHWLSILHTVVYMLPCYFIFSFFWPCCVVYGILVPWPVKEFATPAVKARSHNHWTAREIPVCFNIILHPTSHSHPGRNFDLCCWLKYNKEVKFSKVFILNWISPSEGIKWSMETLDLQMYLTFCILLTCNGAWCLFLIMYCFKIDIGLFSFLFLLCQCW